MSSSNVAFLGNDKDTVIFTYNDIVLKYKGPYSLEFFDTVKTYDNGYIEVMCKFSHSDELIEDYIDLEDLAEELCVDTSFLKEIKEVRCIHG